MASTPIMVDEPAYIPQTSPMRITSTPTMREDIPYVPDDVWDGNPDRFRTRIRTIDEPFDQLIRAIHFLDKPELIDPRYYIEHKEGSPLYKSNANRIDRYGENGCRSGTFTYHDDGYANTRWWSEVKLAVRKDLPQGQRVSLFVDFHGGGFGTGDIHHGGWRHRHKVEFVAKSNVVCVAPNYPLLPWFKGFHITEAIHKFWKYIYSDSFKDDLTKIGVDPINVSLQGIIVSGDSAGGWLAMYSYLTLFELKGEEKEHLDISAVYLQYPMLAHYKRYRHGKDWVFMDWTFDDEELAKYAVNLRKGFDAWHGALDMLGYSIFDMNTPRPSPPMGMSVGNLASAHGGLWKYMFQSGQPGKQDILERLRDAPQGLGRPTNNTKFFVYHGTKDKTCSIEDTQEALKMLEERGVRRQDIMFFAVPGAVHGFSTQISIFPKENVKVYEVLEYHDAFVEMTLVRIHKGLRELCPEDVRPARSQSIFARMAATGTGIFGKTQ